MGAYLIRRLLLIVPVLFGVSVIVFLTMALIPGDPALVILGPYATAERVAALRHDLGLDRSVVQQYVLWIGNVLEGDFGRSFSLDRPVLAEVMDRLGPTALLTGSALVLSTVFGLAAGAVAAARQYGWTDRLLTALVLVGISTPAFWLGLMLILVFAVYLGWFPVSGMFAVYRGGGLGDVLHPLVLPAVTLATVAAGVIARLTRTAMLEVLREDYVRTARAKGLRERSVLYKHAFKNALVAVVPVIGMQVGFLLGGAVYIETVFQWPGIGLMLVNAIAARDILLVQGGVLVVAVAYVFLNLLADVVQRLLDPRVQA